MSATEVVCRVREVKYVCVVTRSARVALFCLRGLELIPNLQVYCLGAKAFDKRWLDQAHCDQVTSVYIFRTTRMFHGIWPHGHCGLACGGEVEEEGLLDLPVLLHQEFRGAICLRIWTRTLLCI